MLIRNSSITIVITLLTLALAPATTAAAPGAAVGYAVPNGALSGACTSWVTACNLQYAISVATPGTEIWVKGGTYTLTGSDPSASFSLKSGVALYGGFATMTETLRIQRNWVTHVTTLSGSLTGGAHAYHVVMANGVNLTAVLDGFTVTRGNASGLSDPDSNGGGMYNLNSSPSIQNVIFTNNTASGEGGAMYNAASDPTLQMVRFVANSATHGGALHNNHSSPQLTNVIFAGNSVTGGNGGAMRNDYSNPTLHDVVFDGNLAVGGNGGALLNDYSSPTLQNVTFNGNSAIGGDGGGLYNDLESTPALTNVTFYSNSAIMTSGFNGGYGGAVFNYATSNYTSTNLTFSANSAVGYDADHPTNGGAIWTSGGTATIINTILWGNTPDQVANDSSVTRIVASLVQSGCPVGSTCSAVTSVDPQLGRLANYGGFVPTLVLLPRSPAIDAIVAYCPATDARDVLRPQGPHCDIGAFEFNLYFRALMPTTVR